MLVGARRVQPYRHIPEKWDYVAETRTRYLDYLPESACPSAEGFVQPYCDSPTDKENVARKRLFSMCCAARGALCLPDDHRISSWIMR